MNAAARAFVVFACYVHNESAACEPEVRSSMLDVEFECNSRLRKVVLIHVNFPESHFYFSTVDCQTVLLKGPFSRWNP